MSGRLCCVSLFGRFDVAGLAFMQGINNPRKQYAFPRVIPNHIWLQIVAMTVIRHCHQFNWPDDAKRPEYPTHHQTFLDWPLPVQLSQM